MMMTATGRLEFEEPVNEEFFDAYDDSGVDSSSETPYAILHASREGNALRAFHEPVKSDGAAWKRSPSFSDSDS